MARIRKCITSKYLPKVIYIICYGNNEIIFWNEEEEKWENGQTRRKRKGGGRYHKMYERGEVFSPLEFLIETRHGVPSELKMKTD